MTRRASNDRNRPGGIGVRATSLIAAIALIGTSMPVVTPIASASPDTISWSTPLGGSDLGGLDFLNPVSGNSPLEQALAAAEKTLTQKAKVKPLNSTLWQRVVIAFQVATGHFDNGKSAEKALIEDSAESEALDVVDDDRDVSVKKQKCPKDEGREGQASGDADKDNQTKQNRRWSRGFFAF